MRCKLRDLAPGGGAALALYASDGSDSVRLEPDKQGAITIPKKWVAHPMVKQLVKSGYLTPAEEPVAQGPAEDDLTALPGVNEEVARAMTQAGFASLADVQLAINTDPQALLDVSGIGPRAIERITEHFAALSG